MSRAHWITTGKTFFSLVVRYKIQVELGLRKQSKIWVSGDHSIILLIFPAEATLTSIWDPGGTILVNSTLSCEENETKGGAATSTPTV